jgi:hypothetical protein
MSTSSNGDAIWGVGLLIAVMILAVAFCGNDNSNLSPRVRSQAQTPAPVSPNPVEPSSSGGPLPSTTTQTTFPRFNPSANGFNQPPSHKPPTRPVPKGSERRDGPATGGRGGDPGGRRRERGIGGPLPSTTAQAALPGFNPSAHGFPEASPHKPPIRPVPKGSERRGGPAAEGKGGDPGGRRRERGIGGFSRSLRAPRTSTAS